jgi:hypothetical protein
MRPSDPSDKERLLRKILRSVDLAGASGAGACPDENRLAGFVEGRLAPQERDGIAAHLEPCRDCGAIVAELAQSEAVAAGGGEPSARVQSLFPRPLALAAAAVVVLGIAIGGWRVFVVGRALDTQSELVACARTLVRERPELFQGFVPLASAERLADVPRVRGGDEVTLVRPAANILEDRPEFVWEAVAGASSYTVTVFRSDGKELWRRPVAADAGQHLAYPQDEASLARGAVHSWKVSCEGPLGSVSNRRPFTVHFEQEVGRFAAQARAIESVSPAELRPLLLAHIAIRAGLLLEAERAARRYVALRPDDAVGRETLYRALNELGSPEAEKWKSAAAGAK